jgi:hypothetical protein
MMNLLPVLVVTLILVLNLNVSADVIVKPAEPVSTSDIGEEYCCSHCFNVSSSKAAVSNTDYSTCVCRLISPHMYSSN